MTALETTLQWQVMSCWREEAIATVGRADGERNVILRQSSRPVVEGTQRSRTVLERSLNSGVVVSQSIGGLLASAT